MSDRHEGGLRRSDSSGSRHERERQHTVVDIDSTKTTTTSLAPAPATVVDDNEGGDRPPPSPTLSRRIPRSLKSLGKQRATFDPDGHAVFFDRDRDHDDGVSSSVGAGLGNGNGDGDGSGSGTGAGGVVLGPQGLDVNMRFTDGTTEDILDLYIGEREPVREVKRRIRLLRPNLGRRRTRLIHSGRILTDGTFLAPWLRSLLKHQKRQAEGLEKPAMDIGRNALEVMGLSGGVGLTPTEEKGGGAGAGAGEDGGYGEGGGGMGGGSGGVRGKGKGKEKEVFFHEDGSNEVVKVPIWIHCSVGAEEVPENEEEVSSEKEQTSQLTPLRGFDRLREAGFSEDDIEEMRQTFQRSRELDIQEEQADEDEHQRALEEQWMEGLNSQNEASIEGSGQGVFTTLFQGLVLGFMLPFIPLFFFSTQIFSKRMQMAILLGIGINLVFGSLRALN